MSYQALYRQWRPLNFDEVIGQNHIVTPLKHQIRSKTYGHAYVFSGTRGTGKTSTAKIFARAVNCLNETDGNPCNTCENCVSILEEQFIDVIEMDAASNNSVDDIRELREHIKFSPSKGRFKVYIIDEVHMLSQGAFNALLKTLEEPPEYVIFILATTELQKIPATILSRCQKYDFKRVSYEDILTRLSYICDQLGFAYEKEALRLIIEKSDGAVRDSLSSLDQCLATTKDTLRREDVIEVLGIVEKTQLTLMVQFLATGQSKEVLLTVDHMMRAGKDLTQFLNGLIGVYRDLLVVSLVKEHVETLVEASEEYIESLKNLSVEALPAHISRALDLLIDLSKTIKFSQNKRTVFETTLIKIMNPQVEQSIEALLERIERLEKFGVTQPPLSAKREVVAVPVTVPVEPLVSKEPDFVEFTEEAIALEDVLAHWDAFLTEVSQKKKALYPFFEGSKPIALQSGRCTVGITQENKLFLNVLGNETNSKELSQMFSHCMKKNIFLVFVAVGEKEAPKENPREALNAYFGAYKNVMTIKEEE